MEVTLYDLLITPDGDLEFSSYQQEGRTTTDLSLVSGPDHIQQSINFRLKTSIREMFLHPSLGNQLSGIIGRRNTRETSEIGRQYILQAITRENFLNESDIVITIIPVDLYKIVYVLEVSTGPYSKIDIVLEMDLENGIRRVL